MEQDFQNLTKKERRELRREERKGEQVKHGRARVFKKAGIISIAVLLVLGAIWGGWRVFSKKAEPPGSDFSREVPDEGRDHVSEGTHVSYKSNPPVSGNHWPDPVAPGVYDKSQPDEGLVHSLEHGMVWISYKSSIPEAAKETLRSIARNSRGVVLTIRDADPTDIALAAWHRLDTFNLGPGGSVDEKRIRNFIARYIDKGPEYVPIMTGKEY